MILLTGASGFIGKNVSKRNLPIRRVLRSYPQSYELDNDFVVVNDMTDALQWRGVFTDVNAIIHLAGVAHIGYSSLDSYMDINVKGTLTLAKEASKAGIKRFVFVSSIGVNGMSTNQVPFSTYSKEEPHNCYSQSKYEAELGLSKISEKTGLEVVIVRPTLVYGPNAPGNFGILTKIVQKLPVLPFGLANNRRDFISVQNLADLLVTCAIHPDAGGHTFLASENETVSIKEFTDAIAKGLGKKVIQLPIPVGLMRLFGKLTGKSSLIEQLFGNLEVNSSNIQQVLGWTPSLTMEQSMTSLKNVENKQ